jgi:hypothetical protein
MLLLITSLCFVCLALIVWGFTGPNRSLRFASLFGASMAGFALPQVIGESNAGVVPPGILQMFIGMSLLCMVAALVGDLFGYKHAGRGRRTIADYDERRVTEAALFLTLVAIVASMLIQVAYGEEIAQRANLHQMSGPMTIAIFFSTIQRYGFALAMLLFWRRKTAVSLAIVLFGTAFYAQMILFNARRGPAVEFIFIVLLTYAMSLRKNVPAILVTLLFVGGTLWSTAIADLRSNRDQDLFEKLASAAYFKDFMSVLENGGLEVRNACDVIQHAYDYGDYDYGKVHWNRLVHAFVPGQIVGYETKESLKFDVEEIAQEVNRRRGTVGAADTGMADCFSSFGYFGCLKYLLIGYFMGRWYRRAFDGDLAAQLAYSTLMSPALHTVSHGTAWLLNSYIHMAVFSYPLLYLARKPSWQIVAGRARRRPAAEPYRVGPTYG